ncbi:MAG: hypothetical protein LBG68_02975, partial [Coriobacteriales bacterium]|nr:hypothetical protein [Coriobacteriales bacterium]
MRCKYCSSELPESSSICRYCGAELDIPEPRAMAEPKLPSELSLGSSMGLVGQSRESWYDFSSMPKIVIESPEIQSPDIQQQILSAPPAAVMSTAATLSAPPPAVPSTTFGAVPMKTSPYPVATAGEAASPIYLPPPEVATRQRKPVAVPGASTRRRA